MNKKLTKYKKGIEKRDKNERERFKKISTHSISSAKQNGREPRLLWIIKKSPPTLHLVNSNPRHPPDRWRGLPLLAKKVSIHRTNFQRNCHLPYFTLLFTKTVFWYGISCFRLTERGLATAVTDPFDPSVGLPAPKLKADIVTISHDAPGPQQVEPAVKGVRRRHHIRRRGGLPVRRLQELP
jgi:hypothetical protein